MLFTVYCIYCSSSYHIISMDQHNCLSEKRALGFCFLLEFDFFTVMQILLLYITL